MILPKRTSDPFQGASVSPYLTHHPSVVLAQATFTDIGLVAEDAEGVTALHFAARSSHIAKKHWLLLMETEIEGHWGGTTLHDAAENGQLECRQTLFSYQIDPGLWDGDGCTARDLAEDKGHRQCAQFLQDVEKLDTGNFICTKCRLVSILEEKVKGLEAQVSALHCIKENEVFLDRRHDLLLRAQHEEESEKTVQGRLKNREENWQHVTSRRKRTYMPTMQIEESGQWRNSSSLRAKIKVIKSQSAGDCHQLEQLRMQSEAIARIETGKIRAPVNPLPMGVSHIPAIVKEGIIHTHQNIATTRSFKLVKPRESSKPLVAELKISKSVQKARITALFAHSGEKTAPADPLQSSCVSPMLDEPHPSDLDALVPTHDERGHLIPEWKRQVMVRKLQARLEAEEGMGRKSNAGYSVHMGDWRYSQAHNGILGPFGELLTEDDLLYLEKQIENLQLRRKCQEHESKLGCLVEELHTILPAPVVNITVNSQLLHQDGQVLPSWCSRVSGMVKSMSLLLTNVDGLRKEREKPSPNVPSEPGMGKCPAGGSTRREILQYGVSVRKLRGNFEKQVLPGQRMASECRRAEALPWEQSGGCWSDKDTGSQKQWTTNKSQIELVCEEHEFGEVENASDSGVSCEEASSDVSESLVPVAESTSLRKERIVMLFLSHWKKSTYMPSLKIMARKTLESQRVGKMGETEAVTKVRKEQVPEETPVAEMSKLGYLILQRNTIRNLIGKWKDIISHMPSQQIRCLNRQQGIYSPEQFLPRVSGVPTHYNSLTLDLFMLGYFHILELDLPQEERKMRHLLCFEVFDHLGRHDWETVRAFHKAVTDEIGTGKRGWKDSFEDIKIRFFGNAKDSSREQEPSRASAESTLQPVSRVRVQSADLKQGGHDAGNCSELGSFNNEICRYIDRSFAFWKEKEAEIFSFKE